MHRQLVMVGGLPGSGKTTYVNRGWPANDYMAGYRMHLETDQNC